MDGSARRENKPSCDYRVVVLPMVRSARMVAILFRPCLQNDCNYIATFVAKGRGMHLKLGGQLANYTCDFISQIPMENP